LRTAQRLHVGVVISLADLLADTPQLAKDRALDQNSSDLSYHRQFGATPSQQVDGIVRAFDHFPAVKGYYISDELPQDPIGPESSARWMGALHDRYAQVKRLGHKPVMGAWYWGDNRLPFLRQVKTDVDELMLDYYPFPDQTVKGADRTEIAPDQSYGPIS